MDDMNKPLVSIVCAAYNHERYISTALDSFLMQETDFPFEVIVHDDASTDNTTEIIREYERKYPDIIKPIYQTENIYSRHILRTPFVLEKAQGKYLAICEGDDFWVSKKKLQTQVMFLENNPEYVLTTHASYKAKEDGSIYSQDVFRNVIGTREVSTDEIMARWMFATNSLVCRKDVYPEVIPFRKDCPSGDQATVMYLALQGRVFNFDEFFGAYRVDSIGSLNWKWRKDKKKLIESQKKLLDMLSRVDEYSDYKYHKALKSYGREVLNNIAHWCEDIKTAKSYPDLYAKMSIKCKIKLYLAYYFPGVVRYLKIIKAKLTVGK